jgi:hypothetical protein
VNMGHSLRTFGLGFSEGWGVIIHVRRISCNALTIVHLPCANPPPPPGAAPPPAPPRSSPLLPAPPPFPFLSPSPSPRSL